MKRLRIFYLVNFIWIIIFGILTFYENNSTKVGLGALESLGKFSLYLGLCALGIVCFIIVLIINIKKK